MKFKKWNIGKPAERDVELLRSAGYPYLLSMVLASRGITVNAIAPGMVNTDILKTIRETGDFTADTEAALDKAVDEFRATFVTSEGKPLVEKKPDTEHAAPIEQEKIVAGEK